MVAALGFALCANRIELCIDHGTAFGTGSAHWPGLSVP